MGLIDRIIGRKSVTVTDDGVPYNPTQWHDLGVPSGSGFSTYPSQIRAGYCDNPYIARCVDLIADTVASLEPIVYDVEGNEVQEPRLKALLTKPNTLDSWESFAFENVADLVLNGNSFSFAVVTIRGVEEVWPIAPDHVSAETTGDTMNPVRMWTVSNGTGAIRVPPERMVHAHRKLDVDGVFGISPLKPAGRSIRQQTSARKWNQALMDNGAKPSTIIMDPHTMTRGQFEEFVARLRGDHAGENNAGKAMVLDGGKTVAAAGFNARDMDYATGVTTSGREIAIALGVPPELVGDSANKTYANAAEANKEFALHTVVPYANRFYGALSAKVCPVYGVARIGFDASQIDGMRGDEAAMMAALQASTFLTVNEKRQRLGFEPVPNGDVILTGMGNVPLDEVATVPGMDTDQGDPLVRLLYSENDDPLQVLADKKPKVRDDDPLQSLL